MEKHPDIFINKNAKIKWFGVFFLTITYSGLKAFIEKFLLNHRVSGLSIGITLFESVVNLSIRVALVCQQEDRTFDPRQDRAHS